MGFYRSTQTNSIHCYYCCCQRFFWVLTIFASSNIVQVWQWKRKTCMVVPDSVIVHYTNDVVAVGYSTFRVVVGNLTSENQVLIFKLESNSCTFLIFTNTFCSQNISTYTILQGVVTQLTLEVIDYKALICGLDHLWIPGGLSDWQRLTTRYKTLTELIRKQLKKQKLSVLSINTTTCYFTSSSLWWWSTFKQICHLDRRWLFVWQSSMIHYPIIVWQGPWIKIKLHFIKTWTHPWEDVKKRWIVDYDHVNVEY